MTTQARELAKLVTNAGDVNLGDDISLASDGAVLNFGADSDVTLTHVADTGLLLNSSRRIQFGDSGTHIRQSADGVLNLTSDTEVEINATTVDINANVDISGNLVLGGNITIGDADSDDISFGGELTSHIVPNATNTYDLGTASKEWRNAFFDGTVTADAFAGPLTGNVTGNTSGTAATVTTAAQTNITSLGTLTALAITGDLDIADTGAGAITVGGTTNTYNAPVVINATDLGIAISDGTKTLAMWGVHGGSSHSGSAVGTRSNHDLAFITNDAKRMVIHSGGSVGIANTTPDSYYANSNQLVVGSGAARQGITIASSTTTIGQLAFADGTSGDARYEGSIVYNHNDNHMELNTNHATAIYIDSAQKVGIGTTSPTEVLDVAGNMALAGTIIHTGDTDTNIAFDTNTINFTTGNITGLQLINGVNYMAGSPTLPSGSAERSYIYHKNVGNTSLHVGNQYGNDAAAIHFETRNTTRMQIDGDGTVQIGNPAVGSAQNLVIMPQGKLYLDAGGDTYIQESAGNVIDITTGGTRRLRVNSDGLIFNTDTAAANALDDYEEGTWTPLIVGTTGSAGTWALSASGAGNNYTKIGNRVFFHMSRYVTNKGSYSGVTKVTGLPFANNGSTTAIALSLFPDADYPDTRMVVAQITGNAEIQFYDGARADIAHDWADLGTGYYLNCAGTYLTDS